MAWIYLGIAGLLEIVWAYSLKKSSGFTEPISASITVVAAVASVVVLSFAMRTLPLGTAYAIWTGIGAVGAFVLGIMALGESASPLRMIAAGLIIAGIALMKVATPA